MAEEFDQQEAFDSLCDIWPRFSHDEKRLAEEAFRETVKTKEVFELVKNQVEIEVEDAKGSYIKTKLRAIIMAALPVPARRSFAQIVAAVGPLPTTGLATPGTRAEEKNASFDDIWSFWPKNDEYPETEDKARQGWEEASLRRPVSQLVEAATHYATVFMNPSKGMKHPKHLCNFIRDDDAVDTALLASAAVIPQGDVAEFEALWAIYPPFPSKDDPQVKEDSMVYWRRHIKASRRPDFYVAVLALRASRREKVSEAIQGDEDSEERYTKSLISFVGSWRTVLKLPNEMATFMGRPLLAAVVTAGCSPHAWGEWVRGAIISIGRKELEDPSLVTVASKVLEIMARTDNVQIDALAVAERLVKETYVRACKPAKSMASSGGVARP